MNASVWVVVLLVLLSGVVAAVGDWLGRRLGKKRLRIGRLRPKHTAIVTTFFAGTLITLATILVLSFTSEPIRVWLTEGTDVQRQLKETKGQLDKTEQQLTQGQRQVKETQRDLAEQKGLLAEEKKKLEQASAEATQMRNEAGQLRGQVASLASQVKQSASKLDDLQKEYAQLEKDKGTLLGNIDEYVRQQKELIDKNNDLLRVNEELEGEIDRLKGQITQLNSDVQQATAAQTQAKNNFEAEISRINAERTKAQADLAQANLELTNAQRELMQLNNSALQLQDNTRRARFNRIIYNRGDEMARLTVRSGLTMPEARSALLGVIEMAARDAKALGAVESQGTGAATFADLVASNGSTITAEIQFNQALQSIVAKEGELLLVVRALYNSFKGDTVQIDVDIVPNKVVYSVGDFIIETRIDGGLGVQGVTEALVGFMSNQLRQRAVSDGMVPAIGRATELGAISQEEVQRIVGDIVATGRTITVRFHAARETRAGDQLVLDIRLR